jgi:hypothetical protein
VAVTLQYLRELTVGSNLNANLESFGPSRVDMAIRWAGNYFLSKTKTSRALSQVACTIDSPNLTLGMADFAPGCLLTAPYGSAPSRSLAVVGIEKIIHLRNESGASGFPEAIAFVSESLAYLYPTPDQAYTINFHFWKPLVAFDPGATDPEAITLNIPDRYAEVVGMGAAGHLVRGMPGTPDGPAKLEGFMQAVSAAVGETTESAVYFSDVNYAYDNNYLRDGLV